MNIIYMLMDSQTAMRLSALRDGCAFLPRNIFWYQFLVVADSTPGSYRIYRILTMV
jgi:hypothetical protein